VRILEARFHPGSKSAGGFVVIGRVFCDQRPITIERIAIAPGTAAPFDPPRLYDKLEFLVLSVARDPCRELLGLRSGFWSFVQLPSAGDDLGNA
jgi:hypothetical protein